MFNIVKLSAALEDLIPKRKPKPPLLSVVINKEEKQEVKEILDNYSPIPEVLYFLLFYLLSSYFFSYSVLYYPTCYHLKFILGNQFSLYLLFLIPVVTGQVPKPFTLPIYFSFSFLYLCPQFGKGMLLVEYPTHERVILLQRYNVTSPEKLNKK